MLSPQGEKAFQIRPSIMSGVAMIAQEIIANLQDSPRD
jgi:hypothetical protein